MERAGYLPGIAAQDVAWRTLTFGTGLDAVAVEVPALEPEQLRRLADAVREAGQRYLKCRSVDEVVASIDTAVARLLDRTDPYRQAAEQLLPRVSGYDAEMVRLGLTEFAKTFRAPQLRTFLAEDFSDPGMLDGFRPLSKGGYGWAQGPTLLAQVWAGNVPALPLWSLVSGLLVKAPSIGKVPSAEPLFAGWFARLLAEVDPQLGQCLAIVWWPGGDEAREAALFESADCVLAYGGNEALASIRARVPVTTRCITYGHKVSCAVVAREALDSHKASAVAHQAAYDVVRYDQQGCYSPHLFFVQAGGSVSPREFASYLASELAAFEHKFPRRELSLDEAASLARWRNAAELRAMNDPQAALLGGADATWSVAFVPQAEALSPSGLNRTVKVVAVEQLDAVVEALAPFRALLQTVGVAASPQTLFHLSGALSQVGVTRVSAIGQMTAPEAGWHHDGRFNLLDLVTVTEIEDGAVRACDAFAPYAE